MTTMIIIIMIMMVIIMIIIIIIIIIIVIILITIITIMIIRKKQTNWNTKLNTIKETLVTFVKSRKSLLWSFKSW